MDRKRILDEIINSKGYHTALFTTFNFDVSFFERYLLSQLYANNTKKVSVFVDEKEFSSSLKNIVGKNYQLGKKYVVSRVNINGAFHPKVVLLLGDNMAKLIVTSANITMSGYEQNNEIFNVITYNPENKDNLGLIVEAIDFFKSINSISDRFDDELLKEIDDLPYYVRGQKRNDRFFIHNINLPIIDQIKNIIVDKVTEIKIIVPYYDKKTEALKKITETFGNVKITLYIQQRRSTFPQKFVDSYHIKIFDKFEDDNSNFYHGKVILFKTEEKDYILYGSANCTSSALLNTYESAGNVEADLLDVDEPGAFDGFFSSVSLVNAERLISNELEYTADEKTSYRFIKCEIENECINCFISSAKNDDIVFKYDGVILDSEYIKGIYRIEVKPENINLKSNVFEISVECGNDCRKVICWFIDKTSLLTSRNAESDNYNIDINPNTRYTSENYQKIIYALLHEEQLSLEDIQLYKELKAENNRLKNENEVPDNDDESGEDYIYRGEIIHNNNKRLKRYEKARAISGRFIAHYIAEFDYKKVYGTIKNATDHSRKTLNKPSKDILPENQRFEQYIKKKVKNFLSSKNDEGKYYWEIISIEHYVSVMSVFFNIFDSFGSCYNENGIFLTRYVLETKNTMLAKGIEKYINNQESKPYENDFVIRIIKSLIDNHFINYLYNHEDEYEELEIQNRRLLLFTEKKFRIRENLKKWMEKLNSATSQSIEPEFLMNMMMYLDGLYGYMRFEQIIALFSKEYTSVNYSLEKNNLIFDLRTNNIRKEFKPKGILLREISRYSKAEGTFDKVVLKIINNNMMGANPIYMIEQKIDLEYQQYSYIIIRKNGKKEYYKDTFFNI